MLLKSIELKGFKSFADRTELILRQGITTIVGPNGSGKSNISDGVRWVLGEQSVKSLRGGKMEDVIFAGTQFRKSLGLAQVSMTLDNSNNELPIDYSLVTISRRLYRSGESEYYINNTQCRLKDIQELFMDTGIGKEGYSIIGQGKIDTILSGKPEERRNLLEEAAGIVKFKTRKEEAEKKLEITNANLTRLNDIIYTLEERIEPLRIDSEKAKMFVELSERLKSHEINLLTYSIEDLLAAISNSKESLSAAKNEASVLDEEGKKYKSILDDLNIKLESCEKSITDKNNDFYKRNEELHNKESEIKLLYERTSTLKASIEKLNDNIKEAADNINVVNEKYNSVRNEEEELVLEKSSLSQRINDLEAKVGSISASIEDSEKLIKNYKDDQIDTLSAASNVKNTIAVLNNKQLTLNGKIEQTKNICNVTSNSVKTNELTRSELLKQFDKNEAEVLNINSLILSKKKELKGLIDIKASCEIESKKIVSNINKLEANRNVLINMDKQYEGYNRSSKILMQEIASGKFKLSKPCSILGEVISTDKYLETAIEIALGSAISNIITEDEESAKTLIKHLRDNNLGRATFLPLTTIKGRKLALEKSTSNMEGFIGIASELVKCNEKYREVIDSVLGRVIICKDMDASLKIAKKCSYSFKIVTVAGDVVNPGGSLTGGSTAHKNTSVISRKREIDELQLEIDKCTEDLKKVTNKVHSYEENIRALDDKCINLNNDIYNLNIDTAKVKERISSIEIENKKLQQILITSNEEIKFIEKDIEINDDETSENNEMLSNLLSKLKNIEEQIAYLEAAVKELGTDSQDKRDALTALKIKQAKNGEALLNRQNELDRLKSEKEGYDNKVLKLKSEIEQSILNNNMWLKNIDTLSKEVKDLQSNNADFQQNINELEMLKLEIKTSINKNYSSMDEISRQLSNKEDAIHKNDINIAKLETELDSKYAKLNEEFDITYAEALKYKSSIEDLSSYKKDIENLKSRINELGTVNVSAIEEYKTVSEKYRFMNSQKTDLIKAIDELENVIDDMTGKMKSVFRENFEILRGYFNETFKELFKGGSADLILSNGDELSGSIDITVQPPGKKLQNINLMSGGEKGLSAIALLFAILKMKPTPFCILDEIEAALDDANVLRYAEFLKRYSENIQFIVITHRKGTMEASDALYGVTMEEKGVSKIISIEMAPEEENYA
jgi:chromosome segregation protein